MCGFCNVWVCVYVWVLQSVGVCFDSCVGVLVICVLVFAVFCIFCTVFFIVSFMCIYSYLLLV